MTEPTEIPSNVSALISAAGAAVARFEGERFADDMRCQLIETPIASPIEQLFFVALHTFAKLEYIDLDPEPYELRGEWTCGPGVFVRPQVNVGKYRVDFLITRVWREHGDFGQPGVDRSKAVAVELDGHAFHDRDKHQRSYEKARDRFLQRSGYQVLHFTGSDVAADPFKAVHEVLETLGEVLDPYAPNPAIRRA